MNSHSAEQVSMDSKTLTALQESIAHWTRVVNGEEIAQGSDDCALCAEFYPENRYDWDGDREGDCKGCPVDQFTNGQGCIGTPCARYFEEGDEEVMKQAAIEELAFLKSLLPKEST